MPAGRSAPLRLLRPARWCVLAVAVLLQGCVLFRPPPPRFGPERLRLDVIAVLNVEEPTPAFYRERARLEALGPELDEALVRIVEDGSLADEVRANAVSLLAERRAFGVVLLLRRMTAESGSDGVRAAAVAGLQRFADDDARARNAVLAAVGDPSRLVRLTAIQALDVEDAPLLRRVLRHEDDAQVRTIARQLLAAFEERGAALARDERGQLRTAGTDTTTRIVFQPEPGIVPGGSSEVGALWVQVPGQQLVPLSQRVEVVGGVVPAFFSPDRRYVVFESEREIRVRDLRTGDTRPVGQGIAPRVIPFSDRFVYLREAPGGRTTTPRGTVIEYQVLQAAFASPAAPLEVGRLRASSAAGGPASVRWMVVGEQAQAFVLRGPGVTPFVLPPAS